MIKKFVFYLYERKINKWCKSNDKTSLRVHLGMSCTEYNLFCKNKDTWYEDFLKKNVPIIQTGLAILWITMSLIMFIIILISRKC